MAEATDWSKDGAGAPPWADYAPHLVLLGATVAFLALRVAGVVGWPWWVVLTPLWLLVLVYVASYVAAVTHPSDDR